MEMTYMKATGYLRGVCEYELTGADPLLCFRRMTEAGVQIWNVKEEKPLTVTFTSFRSKEHLIKQMAKRTCCDLRCCQSYGIGKDMKRALDRPFLIIGIFLAIMITILLQTRIWIIEVQDCTGIDESGIIRVLQDLGVSIGMSGRDVEEQVLKYELLQKIPELSWVAVNRSSGRVTVLAVGREEKEERDPLSASHLIACRDGVITELTVLEGEEVCKVGDSVKEGQLLVSGVEDYGLYLRAVQADGEIYARTWHEGMVLSPAKWQIKTYSGRQWNKFSLILGRKRINFSRNSSILGSLCDKMVDSIQLSLFGYEFPIILQREIYREYALEEAKVEPRVAYDCLNNAWVHLVQDSMVGGRIEDTQSNCIENGGVYIYRGESLCHELISRRLSIQPPFDGG